MWLIRRLFGGADRRRRGYRQGWGYPGPPTRYGSGYGRRPQRGGFRMVGPFPSYSTRTRGGARVSVGGCCLPIPLTLAVAVLGAARALARR